MKTVVLPDDVWSLAARAAAARNMGVTQFITEVATQAAASSAESDIHVELGKSLVLLEADVQESILELTGTSARFLVLSFLRRQGERIRTGGRVKAAEKANESFRFLNWLFKDDMVKEHVLVKALTTFVDSFAVGQWLTSQYGIKTRLAAIFIGLLDVRERHYVGAFWRYAGCDPSLHWLGKEKAKALIKRLEIDDTRLTPQQVSACREATGQKEKRIWEVYTDGFAIGEEPKTKKAGGLIKLFSVCPYNRLLKTLLLGRVGDTLNKFRNRKECFYGQLMLAQQKEYWEFNLDSAYSAIASKDAPRLKETTDAWKWKTGWFHPKDVRDHFQELAELHARCLEQGMNSKERKAEEAKLKPKRRGKGLGIPMLPPGQIYNRARRWTVKLLISHFHHVAHCDYYGEPPPDPYVVWSPKHPHHTHAIQPPGWPGNFTGRSLRELFGDPPANWKEEMEKRRKR